MTKPLSKLLAEVEPITASGRDAIYEQLVPKAYYDKLKAIAVELAKALDLVSVPLTFSAEKPSEVTVKDMLYHYSLNIKAAQTALTTARKMLGDA